MRKKIVLQSEPCMEPETMMKIRGKRYSYGYDEIRTIAKAQLILISDGYEGEVLNIDIFHNGRLKTRYFADKRTKSRRTLIVDTGEWKPLCLQNAANVAAGMEPDYNSNRYYCCVERWEYETEKDENIVRQYLGQDVQYWESEIQSGKRYVQLKNKQARIDARMAEAVPDIPEDFYRWMHEDVFGQRHLFQKKLNKMIRIQCTACGKKWLQKKAVGIGKKTCPKCGKTVLGTYKQKEESSLRNLYLLQPCPGGREWIERYFKARCEWTPEHVSQVKFEEQIRIIVDNGHDWGVIYYNDGPIGDGQISWWDTNHFNRHFAAGWLYPGNLMQMREHWPETLAHSGIEIIAGRGTKFNVNRLIIEAHNNPCLEYIIKGGFKRLASEIIDARYYSGDLKINQKGKTAQEVLLLSADRVNRLRQMDGGITALQWLQYENRIGKKISQSNLLELNKHGIRCRDDSVWKILSYVKSPDVFANYIRKQAQIQKTSRQIVINDWVDYLDMAKKQKLNLSHELFYKPKNLNAAHDACVRAAQHEELKKKAAGILQKFPDVEKIMDSIRDKYTYDGKDFSIVVPADIADIIHEGRALGHCIDTTDRYFDRIQSHITYLVFLRRRSMKDTPYYTLEIEPGGTIRQQRTTGNNQNKEDVKEYSSFIHEWQRVVRDRISEEDRQLAEVSRQTRIREYQELRDKQEKVWRGALAGKLLVDVLEADLIEAI